MNSSSEDKARIDIQDELDKINIDQLHRATLNFSKNCLEVKKLCVTAEIAVLTLLAGLYYEVWQSTSIEADALSAIEDELRILISIFSITIPALFYFVDVGFYYYQDKLRDKMNALHCAIKKRHGIIDNTTETETASHRFFKSLFNGSQVLYLIMILIAIILVILLWPKKGA